MPQNSVIKTTQLKRSFGKQQVINGIDLDVVQGQVYGFLGRNGAGKTTVIKMIMGLIQPSAGTISLFGASACPITQTQKTLIGYVPQEQNYYMWMTATQLAEFVAAFYTNWDHKLFKHLLKVFDIVHDKKVADLSGGTKVKLSLAIAIAHKPALLILDEPTAGLDPIARREFLDIIRSETNNSGVTLFFSSHLVHEIEEVATCIGLINDGKVCYQGSPEFLKASVRMLVPNHSVAHLNSDHIQSIGDLITFNATDAELVKHFRIIRPWHYHEKPAFIIQSTPEIWEQTHIDPHQVLDLSLEDIFIALATGKTCNP